MPDICIIILKQDDMKKIMMLFLSVLLIGTTAKADDKPIEYSKLPQQSQTFITKYFPGKTIALVKMDKELFDTSYEVIFSDGNKVEFDKKGNWKDIDCTYTELPSALVPAQIRNYVSKNYPNIKIDKIEKESRGRISVELSNDVELLFDSAFKLIDIDN